MPAITSDINLFISDIFQFISDINKSIFNIKIALSIIRGTPVRISKERMNNKKKSILHILLNIKFYNVFLNARGILHDKISNPSLQQQESDFDFQTIISKMHMGRQSFFFLSMQTHLMAHMNKIGFSRS